MKGLKQIGLSLALAAAGIWLGAVYAQESGEMEIENNRADVLTCSFGNEPTLYNIEPGKTLKKTVVVGMDISCFDKKKLAENVASTSKVLSNSSSLALQTDNMKIKIPKYVTPQCGWKVTKKYFGGGGKVNCK